MLEFAVRQITAGRIRKANLMATAGGAAGELAELIAGAIQRVIRPRMSVKEGMREWCRVEQSPSGYDL